MKTKDKQQTDESSSPSGETDDAIVTAEVAGSKSARFGLAIDSIGRSTPSHMIPFYVRQVLSQYWAPGAFPLYTEPQAAVPAPGVLGWQAPASVSEALTVTVQEAEDFGSGLLQFSDNRFLNYTDVPMYGPTLDRLSFWRYDPASVEFDEHFAFEAQVVAVDAISQLFVESFDFHFHYLSDLDEEYHRLRSGGPLGVLDDSSDTSPWYNMYHYWRSRLEEVYLDTDLVVLPTGLRNANWTIQDVLDEILELMVTSEGDFRPDIYLTAKGAMKAKNGASLGKIEDAAYADNDGNPRFYMPQFQTEVSFGSGTVDAIETEMTMPPLGENIDPAQPFTRESRDGTGAVNVWDLDGVPNAYETTMDEHLEWSDGLVPSRSPPWFTAPQGDLELSHYQLGTYLSDLPAADGLLNGQHHYWRGHQLNLVQLVAALRIMGRELEPEVARGFLPALGLLESPSQLSNPPMGMSSRMHDDLFNLYTSSFTYRDNPVRTYSAGHLGPMDQVVAEGDITLGDVNVNSYTNGLPTTLRERYWTPELINGPDAIGEILAFFMPGANFEGSMLGDVFMAGRGATALENLSYLSSYTPPGLISRLMGTNASMLTKVEKPVVLGAGVTSPEAVYASGLGAGAVQLIQELLFSVFGGIPAFGLGHNGFVDWQVSAGAIADEVEYAVGTPEGRVEAASSTPWAYISLPFNGTAINGLSAQIVANGVANYSLENAYLYKETLYDVPEGHDDEMATLLNILPPSMAPAGDLTQGNGLFTPDPSVPFTGFREWSGGLGGFDLIAQSASRSVHAVNIGTQAVDQYTAWGMFDVTENDPAEYEEGTTPGLGPFTGTSATNYFATVPTSVTFDHADGVAVTIEVMMNDLGTAGYIYGDTATPFAPGVETVVQPAYSVVAAGSLPVAIPIVVGDVVKAAIEPATDHYYSTPEVSMQDFIQTALFQAMHGDGIDDIEALLVAAGDEDLSVALAGRVSHWGAGLGWNQELSFVHNFTLSSRTGSADPNMPVEFYATRSQFAGAGRELSVEGTIISQTEMTYVDTVSIVYPSPVGLRANVIGWTLPTRAGNVYSRVSTVMGVIGTLAETPGGEWSDHGIRFEGNAAKLHQILDTFEDGMAMHQLGPDPNDNTLQNLYFGEDQNVSSASGDGLDWKIGSRLWPAGSGSGSTYPNELGYVISSAGSNYWGVFTTNNVYIESGIPYFNLRRDNNAIELPPPSGTTRLLSGGSGDSLTYIIPDDPETRMIYRPYRRIVDAAVSRELRQLFMPTHEQTTVQGGPLGLPVYGTPVNFRLAQLVYDAQLPDQYILEKATTKTRMVDPSNRGMLTFSRIPLLDENTQRHTLTDVVHDINDMNYTRGINHTSGASGPVYTIDVIRDIQLGRQFQRFG